MYDGKNVSQGFKGTNFGDVDLWGFEGPPSLKDHEQRLLDDLEFIDDVIQLLNVDNRSTILENLCGLLSVITLCIKDLGHVDLEKRNYAKWEKIVIIIQILATNILFLWLKARKMSYCASL